MTKRTAARVSTPLPDFVAPCLARLGDVPPVGDTWGHEVKFDGYRLQVRIDGGDVRLSTRTGLDWTARFGSLAAAFKAMKVKTALLDGEAIVENASGASDFQPLVHALKSTTTARIVFVAFDLLHLDGVDLRPLPLDDRKSALARCLPPVSDDSRIRFSEHLVGDGARMLTEACKVGLEGIISKRLDKPYQSGRHDDWRKTKCIFNDEFVIAGYLDSSALQDSVGALVLGYFDGNKLVYAGRVGTGFGHASAAAIWRALQPSRTATSPIASALDNAQRKGVRWIEPALVAQIEYRAWTADRLLRHAAFKGLREDLPAKLVKRPQTLEQS